MRRLPQIMVCLALCCALASCAATAEERTGEAEGYGGTLKVMVTLEEGKLASVQVTEHHETEGVGSRAIESMPKAMADAGTWQVDTVSGATVTSEALMAAVRNALGEGTASPDASAAPMGSAQPQQTGSPDSSDSFLPEGASSGIGMSAMGRVGPGKDDTDTPVYSFNVVFAHGVFDAEGRVLSLDVDQLEVATPNYDGASMPHFSGFPGQGGYALWDDAQGKTDGKTEDTEESFLQEVSAWTTKRDRGNDYKLTSGSWREQMDAYQRLFVGKTVDEIEAWYAKFCSDANGKPIKEGTDNEADQAKYAALTDEEKAQLADVTSSATISLRDSHGDILTAIRRAWENAQK